MLISQCPILAVLTQVGNARHGFHFIFKNLRKIYHAPIKNIPTRTGPKSLSPIRPDILKNVTRSRTVFGPVQSDLVKSWFSTPVGLSINYMNLVYFEQNLMFFFPK